MREPDFVGVGAWRAWACNLPPMGQRGMPDRDATIASWLLFCPGAHAAWSYWYVSLCHLRPIEGARPAHIAKEGNGWEMLCYAQHPDHEPDPDDVKTVHYMTPVDWVVQFGEVRDDLEAVIVALSVVTLIMRSSVSPDQDFRRLWAEAIPKIAHRVAIGKGLEI